MNLQRKPRLGVLALMASMAAAGLSIVISRRKEEEK